MPFCSVHSFFSVHSYHSLNLPVLQQSTSTGNSKNDISYSPPSYPSPDSGPSSPSIGPPSDEDDKAFVMRRLYEIAKPERTLILASACTLAVTSSITLLLPYACGNVLDTAPSLFRWDCSASRAWRVLGCMPVPGCSTSPSLRVNLIPGQRVLR